MEKWENSIDERLRLSEPNGFILGRTGSGMGDVSKKEILSALHHDDTDRVYIIDTNGEYSSWVESLGGEVVEVDSVSFIYMDDQKQLVCFDIRKLKSKWNSIGILNVLDYIYTTRSIVFMMDKISKAYVFISDASLAVRDKLIAECLYDIYKESKDSGILITLISRDPTEFYESEVGISLLHNSGYVILLGQAKAERDMLASLLDLTDEQLENLSDSRRGVGEGLIVAGKDVFLSDYTNLKVG